MAALVDIHVACISAVRKKKRNVTAKSTTFFSGKESFVYEQSVFLENSPSICNCFLLVPGLFTGGPLGWPTKRSWALLTTLHRSHTGDSTVPLFAGRLWHLRPFHQKGFAHVCLVREPP